MQVRHDGSIWDGSTSETEAGDQKSKDKLSYVAGLTEANLGNERPFKRNRKKAKTKQNKNKGNTSIENKT